MSANHILQNFLSAKHFSEWIWALTFLVLCIKLDSSISFNLPSSPEKSSKSNPLSTQCNYRRKVECRSIRGKPALFFV